MVDGLTNGEIATSIGQSRATVKKHLHTVMIKWNCRSRVDVAVKALRDGAVK